MVQQRGVLVRGRRRRLGGDVDGSGVVCQHMLIEEVFIGGRLL